MMRGKYSNFSLNLFLSFSIFNNFQFLDYQDFPTVVGITVLSSKIKL